jgi:hypothetical protein
MKCVLPLKFNIWPRVNEEKISHFCFLGHIGFQSCCWRWERGGFMNSAPSGRGQYDIYTHACDQSEWRNCRRREFSLYIKESYINQLTGRHALKNWVRAVAASLLSHSNGGGDAINGFVGANCLRNCARAVDVGQNLNNLIGQLLRRY